MLGKSKLKYIQSLGQKKGRDEEGFFIAEGPKIVMEMLSAGHVEVQEVFALKDWMPVTFKNLEVTEVSEMELGKISQLATPNQVLAIVKKLPEPAIHVKNRLSLALDTIQDPGNLGTIIRIADWFGISQVICSPDCADMYNPKVVQATMGSLVRVQVLYIELATWLSALAPFPVYAASLEGKDVTAIGRIQEGILVIGNESKGISKEVMEQVTGKITIPGKGKAESLNAAVAAGIILSHIT